MQLCFAMPIHTNEGCVLARFFHVSLEIEYLLRPGFCVKSAYSVLFSNSNMFFQSIRSPTDNFIFLTNITPFQDHILFSILY